MKKVIVAVLMMLFWCNVSFAGCIQGNCKNGQGTWRYDDGAKYVGEFKNGGFFSFGERHGQGTYTWADGDKYVGEYKNGKSHGQGTFTWADGSKFVGEYKDGKKHGQGTYTASSGTKYVGEWKDGKSQTFTRVTKSYTPTTNSYEEAFKEQYKKTWWDSIVWFFEDLEDLFESDESEKDKEITELRKRIKRLESNRGTANEIRELKKCVQDISMGLPCYPY